MQTDGEDEENESKFLNELENAAIDSEPKVSYNNSNKEYESGTKRNAEYADFAKNHPKCDYDGIDENGVCDASAIKKFDEPIHDDMPVV